VEEAKKSASVSTVVTGNVALCVGQFLGIKGQFLLILSGGKVGLEKGIDSLTVRLSILSLMKLSGPFASRVAHT